MFLLYADESGSAKDKNQKYFVLAGFCVFERQTFWISNELDAIAARFNPADPASVELHGNPMHSGKGIFRQFPKEDRALAIEDALRVFVKSHPSNRLFASVVDKATVSPVDPVEFAFEQLASRFDHYLTRLHRAGNTQRGVILFDKSTYETTIQSLATDFRTIGHSWGILRNFSEVPLSRGFQSLAPNPIGRLNRLRHLPQLRARGRRFILHHPQQLRRRRRRYSRPPCARLTVKRDTRLSHGLLIPDSLIAAMAIVAGIAFVSKNQCDYKFIVGLNLLAYP